MGDSIGDGIQARDSATDFGGRLRRFVGIDGHEESPHVFSRTSFNLGAGFLWPFWILVHRTWRGFRFFAPLVAWLVLAGLVTGGIGTFVTLPSEVLTFFGSGYVGQLIYIASCVAFGFRADDLAWRANTDVWSPERYRRNQVWWSAAAAAYLLLVTLF